MDDLTWQTLISGALQTFHGIRGLACHFDVLHKSTQAPKNKAVVRISPPDAAIFKTSFINFTFDLELNIGLDFPTGGYIRTIAESPFLGTLPRI